MQNVALPISKQILNIKRVKKNIKQMMVANKKLNFMPYIFPDRSYPRSQISEKSYCIRLRCDIGILLIKHK